jgi:undecaprenyl-diphosphatase
VAELTNPDLDVLRLINGWAEGLTGWLSGTVTFLGEYGFAALAVLLCVVVWWRVRRRPDAPQAVAVALWAPLAAAVAWLVNTPIRDLVARPRPFVDHADVVVLLDGKTGYSFVSDHSTATMAIAVGLLIVHRRLGLVALAVAVLQGFSRVLMGLHYPADVIGGLALGTAVALLLLPLALWVLVPLVRRCAGVPGLRWIAPGAADAGVAESAALRTPAEKGLAA